MSKASLMNKAPWSTKSQKMLPVSWNAYTKTFSIVLTGLKDVVGKRSDRSRMVPRDYLCCSH